MVLRLTAIVLFMFGVITGGLWVLIEGAGALSAGSDNVWYFALALTLAPAVLFALLAFRTRTSGFIGMTVAAVALFVGVVVTYPFGATAACSPTSTNASSGGNSGIDTSNLDGAYFDDVGDTGTTTTDTTASANCG